MKYLIGKTLFRAHLVGILAQFFLVSLFLMGIDWWIDPANHDTYVESSTSPLDTPGLYRMENVPPWFLICQGANLILLFASLWKISGDNWEREEADLRDEDESNRLKREEERVKRLRKQYSGIPPRAGWE